MASNSTSRLQQAANAVNIALSKLEAAVDVASAERASSAEVRESVQADISSGWEQTVSDLETELAQARSSQEFLVNENQRLSNELQMLQAEHLALQQSATKTVSRLNASVNQLDLLLGQTA